MSHKTNPAEMKRKSRSPEDMAHEWRLYLT